MKTNLRMQFLIDKETTSIIVKREFKAPLSSVWSAWREPEILDQWWAPRPWKSQTKVMNFVEGGKRLYAMVGPKGEEQWCLVNYTSITPKTNFKYHDAFCDAEGNIDTKYFSGSQWNVDFTDHSDSTFVNVTVKYNSHEDLEKIIQMGYKEGFIMAMENLDELFSNKH
ncbi:SRPBCC domain-containing protein [Leeuwenhoekiella sp. A16]|uniref:SRPBCC family protein n=1 Tax=unclassified Leeuwenhoekiella TaxID=2615029 RepID=UPI003A8127D8